MWEIFEYVSVLWKKNQQKKMRLRMRRRDCFKQQCPLRRGGDRVQMDELHLNCRSESSLLETREKELGGCWIGKGSLGGLDFLSEARGSSICR